jgi:integrase
MEKFNFTNTELRKLPVPKKGTVTYKDLQGDGLCLYITKNAVKTFFIRKRVNGKDERFIIGNFPDLDVREARGEALIIKGQIAKGLNPNEERRKERNVLTLKLLFEEYMERYSKVHKKSWKYDEREIPKFLGHWFHKKLNEITHQEVRKLHETTFAESGLYQANRILERLRAMYNKAREWDYVDFNPTDGIKKYKEVKRDRFLQPDEMDRFFKALDEEENIIARSYFYILLFTGARKTNVLSMRWEDIHFETKFWRIPDTKNGEPQTVPLIDDAIKILKELPRVNRWVFPSINSKEGHFADPKRPWNRILERANIKDLRIHDIRRTLGSYQAITGSSLQIIGKSLGHKSMDSTQIYARLHTDPVRESMENAVSKMFEYGKVGGSNSE